MTVSRIDAMERERAAAEDRAPEFIALCVRPSDSRPRDGLPCGRRADRVAVYEDGSYEFTCWQCKNRWPKSATPDYWMKLDPDAHVYVREDGRWKVFGYFERPGDEVT